jgi:hypothetical protein
MVERRCAMTMLVRRAATSRERLLDRGLGAAVQRAGRLVEDQDRRVLEQGAAIATRCFSPPESFRPRSPTCVS